MAVQEGVTVREIEKLLVLVREVKQALELVLALAQVQAVVQVLALAQVQAVVLVLAVAQVQAVVRVLAQARVLVRVLAQVREVARVLVINPDEIQRSLQGQPISDENRQGLKARQIDQGMVLVLVD